MSEIVCLLFFLRAQQCAVRTAHAEKEVDVYKGSSSNMHMSIYSKFP